MSQPDTDASSGSRELMDAVNRPNASKTRSEPISSLTIKETKGRLRSLYSFAIAEVGVAISGALSSETATSSPNDSPTTLFRNGGSEMMKRMIPMTYPRASVPDVRGRNKVSIADSVYRSNDIPALRSGVGLRYLSRKRSTLRLIFT